jgi:hypothetical protein
MSAIGRESEKNSEYVCPRGHVMPRYQPVRCSRCEGQVVYEPQAKAMALSRRLTEVEKAERHAKAEAHFWQRRAVELGASEQEWSAYSALGGQ